MKCLAKFVLYRSVDTALLIKQVKAYLIKKQKLLIFVEAKKIRQLGHHHIYYKLQSFRLSLRVNITFLFSIKKPLVPYLSEYANSLTNMRNTVEMAGGDINPSLGTAQSSI